MRALGIEKFEPDKAVVGPHLGPFFARVWSDGSGIGRHGVQCTGDGLGKSSRSWSANPARSAAIGHTDTERVLRIAAFPGEEWCFTDHRPEFHCKRLPAFIAIKMARGCGVNALGRTKCPASDLLAFQGGFRYGIRSPDWIDLWSGCDSTRGVSLRRINGVLRTLALGIKAASANFSRDCRPFFTVWNLGSTWPAWRLDQLGHIGQCQATDRTR